MSHFTTIRTEIRDEEILIETLDALGLAVERGGAIKGFNGRKKRVDIAVKSGGRFSWGFQRASNGETYEAAGLKEVLAAGDAQTVLNRIRQGYACRKVLKEARKRGFSLAQQGLGRDGVIRLILRRVRTEAA